MGIDVYLRWQGQTEAERQAQFTGFSIVHGHVGYLREAYHGAPYATKMLVPEAFESGKPTTIAAALLRERLAAVIDTVAARHAILYPDDSADAVARAQQSYRDFVDLAERKERETGQPIQVYVSG